MAYYLSGVFFVVLIFIYMFITDIDGLKKLKDDEVIGISMLIIGFILLSWVGFMYLVIYYSMIYLRKNN